jgi:hypothetical protein
MQIWCQNMPLGIVPDFSNENLVSKNGILGLSISHKMSLGRAERSYDCPPNRCKDIWIEFPAISLMQLTDLRSQNCQAATGSSKLARFKRDGNRTRSLKKSLVGVATLPHWMA